jgi:hypothetical protein
MSNSTVGDAAIAVVRRNTETVQGKGNWGLFEELFADDFGKKVSFYTVDAMRVVDGKITEHWGVATLLDLMQQLGVVPSLGGRR